MLKDVFGLIGCTIKRNSRGHEDYGNPDNPELIPFDEEVGASEPHSQCDIAVNVSERGVFSQDESPLQKEFPIFIITISLIQASEETNFHANT